MYNFTENLNNFCDNKRSFKVVNDVPIDVPHTIKIIIGNYGATSNNMKLIHLPLMGGLLHLVQRGGACVGGLRLRPVPSSLYYSMWHHNCLCTIKG